MKEITNINDLLFPHVQEGDRVLHNKNGIHIPMELG